MRFAAVETSTEWCSVALYRAGEIACLERRAVHRHSELVLPMLDRLLEGAGLDVGDLEAVAFGAGPGAFTGLRIACGVAQGLAFARGLPVLGVSTLEALAEESGATRVAACLDARMREVYYAALEKDREGWRQVIAARCIAPQAAPRPPGEGWIGCGSGFSLAHPWQETLGAMKLFPEVHASAAVIARLAAPRLARGDGRDAAEAAPLYLRDKVAFTKDELK